MVDAHFQPSSIYKRGNSRPFIQITRGAPFPYDYEDQLSGNQAGKEKFVAAHFVVLEAGPLL